MADAARFDKNMAAAGAEEQACRWLKIPHPAIRVEGLGFFAAEGAWNRLPEVLLPVLREKRPALVELARHTAGAALEFVTDSPNVWVRATVDAPAYMSHMTPAAQCGFDCYVQPPQGDWIFAGLTKFPVADSTFCCQLARDLPPGTRVRIHLPLYIGVQSVEVGLQLGSKAEMPPAFSRRAVAFYGTSITQGGCATRPGMAYPAILSRLLDAPAYNLGFSGNGVGMPELAGAICALPKLGALVVDIEANAAPEGVLGQNLPRFLDAVRAYAPQLPVLVLSASLRPASLWNSALAAEAEKNAALQREEVEKRRAAGDDALWFADARQQMGPVGPEATVDGTHLTDLGFYALAQGLAPLLDKMLK